MNNIIRRPASVESELLLCPPAPWPPAAVGQGRPGGWRAQQQLRFYTEGPSLFYFTTFPRSNTYFPRSNTHFPRSNTHFYVVFCIVWSKLAPTSPWGLLNGPSQSHDPPCIHTHCPTRRRKRRRTSLTLHFLTF